MDTIEYINGQHAAAEAVAYMQAGAAHPDELESALARLTSDAARSGFLRQIQKHIERTKAAA
jgi:hypothetical protein